MGFEYHLQTVRGWRGDAPLPFERVDAVEEDLDGGRRGEFLEDYFNDLSRAHRKETFAALFVSDADEWLLWVTDAGKARETFLAVVLEDGMSWETREGDERYVTLDGSPDDIRAFQKRWALDRACFALAGCCCDPDQLATFCASLARLADNEEAVAVVDWVGTPVLLEVRRGAYRIRSARMIDEEGRLQHIVDRLVEREPVHTTAWVHVEPSVHEVVGSKNRLRSGSMRSRVALAKEADRFPSRANVDDLIEARFAPECRASNARELRSVLERAIGRHDERALNEAVERVLRGADAKVATALRRLADSCPSAGDALIRLSNGTLPLKR